MIYLFSPEALSTLCITICTFHQKEQRDSASVPALPATPLSRTKTCAALEQTLPEFSGGAPPASRHVGTEQRDIPSRSSGIAATGSALKQTSTGKRNVASEVEFVIFCLLHVFQLLLLVRCCKSYLFDLTSPPFSITILFVPYRDGTAQFVCP